MNEYNNRLSDELTEEALDELRAWLVEESKRIEHEKNELHEAVEKFKREKEYFQTEMKTLFLKLNQEQKILNQNEMFFSRKQEILQNGFKQLDVDRRNFEQQKAAASKNRIVEKQAYYYEDELGFFSGVTNPLALRKRYRDLIKIFHPDNLCGDNNIALLITKEYENLKNNYE